ncbi:TPA: leucyl aminopeptidase [Patescibacteria group bacterium]|nr:leucyl aminopeptidase [Patescibacteria group bacterium]
MKFQVKDIKSKPATVGLVLCYFAKEKPSVHPLYKFVTAADKKQVERLFKAKEFSSGEKQSQVILGAQKKKILLIGLGEKKNWNLRHAVLAARRITNLAKNYKVKSVTIGLETLAASGVSSERLAQTVTENMVLADYVFNQYKKDKGEQFTVNQAVLAVSKMALKSVSAGVKIGEVVGAQVNYARDLGNTPGGEMTPTLLANRAKEVGRVNHIKVTVLNQKQMEANKMGAILGVAKGSSEEPKFIIMEYYGGKKNDAPFVFVGKGVTFDTGGLNLKPEDHMLDMWMDMCGGAAVISALGAIAKLKLPVNVMGLVPAVENMPGGAGYRPGDLLKSLSGKYIEVLNTDAEGRVILADALTYAERYKPRLVVDVATLTGACMVALGAQAAGLFTPDDKIANELLTAGEISGDYLWRLPLWEEYADEVKGTFGDVQNMGKSRYGGAITAAMFLYQFAKKYPWVHIDIAGTMKAVDGQGLAKGATGTGTRVLIELAKNYK